MMEGETIHSGAPDTCEDCGIKLEEEVLQSAAGFYIGTWCNCGPHSRESEYYPTRETAQTALDNKEVKYRTSEFNPTGLTVVQLEDNDVVW